MISKPSKASYFFKSLDIVTLLQTNMISKPSKSCERSNHNTLKKQRHFEAFEIMLKSKGIQVVILSQNHMISKPSKSY